MKNHMLSTRLYSLSLYSLGKKNIIVDQRPIPPKKVTPRNTITLRVMGVIVGLCVVGLIASALSSHHIGANASDKGSGSSSTTSGSGSGSGSGSDAESGSGSGSGSGYSSGGSSGSSTIGSSDTTGSSNTSASCYPMSDEGNCYEPGEYCRDSDEGTSGVAADGESITCEDNDGLRWEPN